MLKGNNYLYPNAIVDFDLKILDSNSFFNDFFKQRKEWKNLSIKITDLIEFDNLSGFKEFLYSQKPLINSNSSFKGKIKNGEKFESVKVTINHLQKGNQNWSNQTVELTCQRIEQVSSEPNYPKLVLENSPFRIFTIDRKYNLTFFNQSTIPLLEIILGEKPILGESFFTKEEQKKEWKNSFDMIFSNEKLFLKKKYQKENENFNELLFISPLKNNKGFINGCIVYTNDVLKLRKGELLHYQNDKKYQNIFENNYLGIGILNEKGNLVQANDSFCRLIELEKLNFDSLNADDFFYGDDHKLFATKFKQIYKGEISHFSIELKIKTIKNNFKYIQLNLNGLYENERITACLFSTIDISSQKNFFNKEQEIKNLRSNDEINYEYQRLLEQELDSKIRELTINQMLISQKNNLIKEVSKKLEELARKSSHEIKPEIRKIISSISRQNVFDNDWENLKIHFVKMHPSFFNTLTSKSAKITQKDLRHCAYLKLGFSAKEASDLLGTLPRSIEQARFRIKKKLNLPATQKLKDYLRSI